MDLFGLGAPELLLIVFLLLLFFGKDKLPSLAKSIGHSFRELKSGFNAGEKEDSDTKEPKKKS
jgi:sec-independent protein translocase protein TatA